MNICKNFISLMFFMIPYYLWSHEPLYENAVGGSLSQPLLDILLSTQQKEL
jgi:hypothetical protein